MKREEAQFILLSSRPDGLDAGDPAMAEAHALLESDAELNAWFAREQAFDRGMIEALEGIQPPQALKTEILAGMRAQAAAAREAPAETVDFDAAREDLAAALASGRSPWTRWAGLAAAAIVLFMLGTQVPRLLPPAGPPTAAEAMPEFLSFLVDTYNSSDFALEHQSNDLRELQAHLVARRAPVAADIPENILKMDPVGCLKLQYDGIPIGLVCVKEGELVYHLYSADRKALAKLFPNFGPTDLPAYFSDGENAFKVWTDSENVNILTRKGDVDSLRDFY